MEEAFQANWLHEKGQNAILTNAFEEAREEDFQTLSDMRQKFEGKRLNWILSMAQYPKISEFIISYNTVLNINFDVNGKEWDGNETFSKACDQGQSELFGMLIKHSSTLNIDLPPPCSPARHCWQYPYTVTNDLAV